MQAFDQIVIGGGPGGLALAYGLKAAGKNVAIVEENLWGGTCPNRGCDPKKILVAAVEAKRHAEQLANAGLDGTTTINWPDLMRHKFAYTDAIPDGTLQGLQHSGITTFYGHATFTSAGQLAVGEETLTATQFILATGQRPARPTIDGAELLQTSTDFLNWRQLPKQVAFIGGGYIAFELADIANAAGADVHVILRHDRALRAFDAELVKDLRDQLEQAGVHFHENVALTKVAQTGAGVELIGDQQFDLTVAAAVAVTGRTANVDTLNLAAVGVAADKHGVVVNDHLQTTNEHIYALGDVVAKKAIPKLTPVAGFEARYLTELLTGASVEAIQYPAIPTVVFGMPRLAQVGVSPAETTTTTDRRVKTLDMTHWYTYQRIHDPLAKVKVVLDRQGRLVGASALSTIADELINYLTTLINQGATVADVNNQIMAYPTPASDLSYLF